MTVEEQTPHVGVCRPVEGSHGCPEPVGRADPAAQPNLPSHGSHDELAFIQDMMARLSAAYPSVSAVTVEATVRTAYGSFHQARVRAYVPILVERRSRRVLSSACRNAPGQANDGRAAAAGPEQDAAVRAGGGVEAVNAPTAPETVRSGL